MRYHIYRKDNHVHSPDSGACLNCDLVCQVGPTTVKCVCVGGGTSGSSVAQLEQEGFPQTLRPKSPLRLFPVRLSFH